MRSVKGTELDVDVDRQGNVVSWGVLVTFDIEG